MRSHIPGTNVGVGMNHMDIFYFKPEFFGNDLCDNRVRALPHIRGAGKKIDFAEIVHFNYRSAAI